MESEESAEGQGQALTFKARLVFRVPACGWRVAVSVAVRVRLTGPRISSPNSQT